MSINPLANPKGVKLNCELCSKPALLFCTKCRVTYYCDTEHQNIDWIGIHEKICELLIPLKSPITSTCNSEEEREQQKKLKVKRQKDLVYLTRTAGQKLLFEGKYEYAIPAAMQSLKISIEIYGLNSIELVLSYLILGEACIGLRRLTQAEEYLSQAKWTVTKTPACTPDILSKLHRNLGLLHATKQEYKEALRNLSEDIFYASTFFGTHNIRTSGGYFHMANVFYAQNKLEVAFSLYQQITTIWFDHLSLLVAQRTRQPPPPVGIGPAQYEVERKDFDNLDEAEAAEALLVLNSILEMRSKQTSPSPLIMMELLMALSMLYFVQENYYEAMEYSKDATTFSKKISNLEESKRKSLEDLYKAIETRL